MEDESLFKLFDSCWFQHQIFKKEAPPSNSQPHPYQKTLEISNQRLPAISTTSIEDLVSSSSANSLNCFSPSSVLLTGRLPTIFSGKEATESSPEQEAADPGRTRKKTVETETPRNRGADQRRRKKKLQRRLSKSLSDLEFEELRGFIDLGFAFSEEDKNSEFLATILPGLQRLGLEGETQKEAEEEKRALKVKEGIRRRSVDESGFSRANYLKMQRRKNDNTLKTTSWGEIPVVGSEVNMKDYLRSWAHNVASSVR